MNTVPKLSKTVRYERLRPTVRRLLRHETAIGAGFVWWQKLFYPILVFGAREITKAALDTVPYKSMAVSVPGSLYREGTNRQK